MKFCKACGYRVPQEADSCPLCGGRLSAAPDHPPQVHAHQEPGEQCVLPNQEPPRQKSQTSPAQDRAGYPRLIDSPGKPLLKALTVIFALTALLNLLGIVLDGIPGTLGGLVGCIVLAQLSYKLSQLPPGVTQITDRSGKSVSVGRYVLPRIILALLLWGLL